MELIGDSNRWLTSGALSSAGVVNGVLTGLGVQTSGLCRDSVHTSRF